MQISRKELLHLLVPLAIQVLVLLVDIPACRCCSRKAILSITATAANSRVTVTNEVKDSLNVEVLPVLNVSPCERTGFAAE